MVSMIAGRTLSNFSFMRVRSIWIRALSFGSQARIWLARSGRRPHRRTGRR
jgi:hypothetical protein